MFFFIIGDFIFVDDKYWENFFRLFKVEEIVFVLRISVQLVVYFVVFIEEYFVEFSEFDDRRIILKQYYMVYYLR